MPRAPDTPEPLLSRPVTRLIPKPTGRRASWHCCHARYVLLGRHAQAWHGMSSPAAVLLESTSATNSPIYETPSSQKQKSTVTPTSKKNYRDTAVFLFFIFVFYKNIFSFSKFTEIYPGRPAAGRPGPGRGAAGTWSPRCGAAGAFLQKNS